MYIKLNNGVIEKYPYKLNELRKDNNQTSFPSNIPDSLLAEYDVYRVESTPRPDVGFARSMVEGQPELVDGVWKQVWVEVELTNDEKLSRVLAARAEAYPPMSDYLDGVVKGDQAQIDKYISDCLAVKLKYPKP
jgi:hypothetical protein